MPVPTFLGRQTLIPIIFASVLSNNHVNVSSNLSFGSQNIRQIPQQYVPVTIGDDAWSDLEVVGFQWLEQSLKLFCNVITYP